MHSIHDWRFLFVIFGIEILGIIYLLHRSNRSAHFVILLVALQVVHEILYLHGLVPVMHWFIPNSDPFVREVIRYQWIAVGCGIAGFALSSFFFRNSKGEDGEDEGPTGSNRRESPCEQREEKPDSEPKISEIREKERFGRPEILALGCIAAFLLAQQVIGYLSGYWINQEPDTGRYQGYGYVFLTTGFKGFVDLWLEPGARVHATHTDQPFVPPRPGSKPSRHPSFGPARPAGFELTTSPGKSVSYPGGQRPREHHHQNPRHVEHGRAQELRFEVVPQVLGLEAADAIDQIRDHLHERNGHETRSQQTNEHDGENFDVSHGPKGNMQLSGCATIQERGGSEAVTP